MLFDALRVANHPPRSLSIGIGETVFMVQVVAFRIRLEARMQAKVFYRLLQDFGMGMEAASSSNRPPLATT